jgi:AmiR/NasT family two-component response regulator
MAMDLIRDLRGTRVLVVHPTDQEVDELVRHLKRIGCQVRLSWPGPAAVTADVDVVFLAVGIPGASPPPQLATGAEPALIAIVDYENPTALKSLLDANALGVISKPIRPSGILSSMVLARALQGYQGRLMAKVAKLEETLRSRREIEHATRILMQVKGLSEDGAYQLLRQQATTQRLAMGVVARSIITAHRVFEGSAPQTRPQPQPKTNRVLRLPARK